jgi:hypothetical protein
LSFHISIAQARGSKSNNHIDLAPSALLFASTTSPQLLMTSVSFAMYASKAASLTIVRDSAPLPPGIGTSVHVISSWNDMLKHCIAFFN